LLFYRPIPTLFYCSIYIIDRYVFNLALKLQNADFTYFEQPVVYNNIDVYVVKYAAEESEL